VIKAPRDRVWRALTDHQEFSEWFGVVMAGPFEAGKRVTGRVTIEAYKDLAFALVVEKLLPPRYFSWRWNPAAIDPKADYSQEPMTLVEFTLDEVAGGTKLTVVESGFDQIPAARRAEAFRLNNEGWNEQMVNIERHVRQSL
jgi:uncharacterized protein YndB with AHSA1/START domain